MVLSFQLKQETEKVKNKRKRSEDFDRENISSFFVKNINYNATDERIEYCQMASVWEERFKEEAEKTIPLQEVRIEN